MIVPTLILPRDDELEILGRTVEQTLGRSVQSIDVIGRGELTTLVFLSIVEMCSLTTNNPFVDPLSRASFFYRAAVFGLMMNLYLVDLRCCHEGWQSSHRPRCRLAYAHTHHGIRGPSPFLFLSRLSVFYMKLGKLFCAETDCDDAVGPRTDVDPCTQNLDL